MLSEDTQKLDGLRTYIDGKLKRYSLLFSVNGGAFAIAKLTADTQTHTLLGGLKIGHLAFGAIFFTMIMSYDIWLWAQMMKRNFLGNLAFNWQGKTVLLSLASLVIAAWALVWAQ